jgi:membrane protein implicated in regulation of membrane protease activity
MKGGFSMNWAAITWLAIMAVLLIVEAACPFHLVSIWFAAGALVAMIISMLGGELWLQIIAFCIVSGALLAGLWPFIRKFLNPHLTKTNVDSVIGTEGIVTADIDNLNAVGQVKLGGMEWTARSTSGDKISAGTRIRVDRIEGVKAFVSPVEVTETV